MKRLSVMVIALVATVSSAVAETKPKVLEQFNTKSIVTIDPTRAYILYRTSTRLSFSLLREVSSSERVEWQKKRDEAFAKALKKYQKALDNYVLAKAAYAKLAPSQRGGITITEKPVEVTDETFSIAPPEIDNMIFVDGGRVIAKEKPNYAYLLAVQPGTYTVYGEVASIGNVVSGTCLCMGSVKFDAAAGKVTDLGEIHAPFIEALVAKQDVESLSIDGMTKGRGGLTAVRIVLPNNKQPIPPVAAALPRVPVSFRAAGKMPNYYGIAIDRITQIPGIVAYRRGDVIDVSTGETLPIASNYHRAR